MTAAVRIAPRDLDGIRWTLCALVALAAHLAGGIALLLWHAAPIDAALPPPPAIIIDLAPAEPSPAPVPVAAPDPEPPPPTPAIIEPPPALPDPLPELKPAAQAEVALPPPPPKPRPRPPARHLEAPPPRPVTAAPPEPATPPAPAPEAKTAEPAPPSVATAKISEDVLAKFLRTISMHLERLKRYPREAVIRHEQGIVLLRFLLARDGSVLGAELERSSGHEALDREVLALIRRAEPLPAFPPELTQRQLQLILPVPFSLR